MKVSVPRISANRRKTLYLLYKRHIVQESRDGGSLKSTARKYGVEACQIRRWKRAFDKAMEQAVIATSQPGLRSQSISRVFRRLSSTNRHRFKAGGRPTLFTEDFLSKIKKVVDNRRAANLSVSMHIIRLESRKLHPTIFDKIAETAFNQRMYRMMKKWDVSWRRKTTNAKVAQNTRHTQEVKAEYLKYFKFKIKLLNVIRDDVFNADQTNLPFSMESPYTWAHTSSRSVAVPSIDSNQRATVQAPVAFVEVVHFNSTDESVSSDSATSDNDDLHFFNFFVHHVNTQSTGVTHESPPTQKSTGTNTTVGSTTDESSDVTSYFEA
jgi:hypothetical protein